MHGLKDLPNYLLITPKTKMMINIVYSMKVKTHILNAFPKVNLLSFFKYCSQLKTDKN